MSDHVFLWFVFGGWLVLLAIVALTQLKMRPGATSFAGPMITLGLITGASTVAKTHSFWWGLAVAAMGLVGYVVLGQVVRVSTRPTDE